MHLPSLFVAATLLVVPVSAYTQHGTNTNRAAHGSLRAGRANNLKGGHGRIASALTRRASGSHVRYSYYHPEESGNPTACGEMHNSNSAIVAVPVQQFDNSMCNKQVKVEYKGKTVTAKISDACHGCPDDSLDLTPMLFSALDGSTDAGVLWGGSWSRTDGSGDQFGNEPSSSTRPDPTTTTSKKPEPTTTESSTESTTTSSKKKSSSSSSSAEPTSTEETSSAAPSPSTTSHSSESDSAAEPSQTVSIPGSIRSLEDAFDGIARFLLAGAQLEL